MRNYEELIRGLQEDMEVPESVRVKFEKTLAELPEKKEDSRRRRPVWPKLAASAAAVAIAGAGFCYANPTLAAKIPVIGRIFENIEEDLTFSGNYSDNRVVLAEEQESPEAAGVYTAENQGVEITASEIYCDGQSVFLTAEVKVEAGGLKNIPAYYTGRFVEDSSTAQGIYTRGTWSFGGKKYDLLNNNFEGKVLDDQTYIGMMKLDVDEEEVSDGVLELSLTEIGYDDINELQSEDITASHKVKGGAWDLSVPVTVDKDNTKVIDVGKKLENGYGIDRVVLSPYQLVVCADIPPVYQDASQLLSREEFDAMMEEEKTAGETDPGISYEEFAEEEMKQKQYYDLAVFDQDGEPFMLANSTLSYGKQVFAVKNKEITRLYIYLFDDMDTFPAQKLGLEEAKEKALVSAEVEIP